MYNIINHLTIICVLLCIFSNAKANPVSDVSLEALNVLPVGLDEEFFSFQSDHFHVVHDQGLFEANELSERLETAYRHFGLFFESFGFELKTPNRKLTWISFSNSEYFSRYAFWADRMDLSRLGGYYSARTNRVAIKLNSNSFVLDPDETPSANLSSETGSEIAPIPNGTTGDQYVKVAHELAHQLAFNTGLQKRGVMYPLWVSEGLATQYETELSYCRNTNSSRRDRLLEMQKSRRLIPLDEFIAISRLPGDPKKCEEIYAQAWGFFRFLLDSRADELKTYFEKLHQARLGPRSTAAMKKEFIDTFGSLEQLNQAWLDSNSICPQ